MFIRTTLCRMINTDGFKGATRFAAPIDKTLSRKDRIELLADDVFGRGNQVLKRAFTTLDELPEGKQSFPEVCFIGRPNSGKTSIVSALTRNKFMTRPTIRPGNTDHLAFYNIGDSLLLVDTPGWGAWRKDKDMQFNRSRALGLMRQYISIRKETNLQRVYWTMNITPSGLRFGPREDELAEFLGYERIPFTILLTKIDRVKFDQQIIREQAEQVFDYFGTRDVPIMEVCADPYKQGKEWNMDQLQYDIVHECCKDLPDEKLTVGKMQHELSYLPPSADEKLAAEQKYPIEAHLLPEDNRTSMAQLVADHKQQKKELLDGFEQGQTDLKLQAGEIGEIMSPMDNKTMTSHHSQNTDEVASVVGVPVPKSMVSASVTAKLAKVEGTLQNFKELTEMPYQDVVNHEGYFMENETNNDLVGKRMQKSEYKKMKKELTRKYLDKDRKARNLYMHSGVLCPWLGDEGRGGVQGLDTAGAMGQPTGRSRVPGLKGRGFGGKSHSPKTLRNKGRSTNKVFGWGA